MSLRDTQVVILETSRDTIRVRIGLHEFLRAPSFEFFARVGLPKTIAEQDGPGPSTVKVSDYLVGPQLDEALAAGQDLIISWPFVGAQILDWTQAEAIWKHALFATLGLRRTQMESPVQLSIFPGLPRPSCERICQMFFERFNVAGFSILERPMAQIYSSNALNGLIIDLGYHWTDISAVYDGFLLHQARASTPVGIKACLAFLVQVLKTNTSIASTLSPPENPLSPEALHQAFQDLASTLYHKGHIKPPVLGPSQLASGEAEDEGVTDIASIIVAGKERAVIEANIKKRANQKASAAEQAKLKEIEALDLLTIEFNGKEVTVGKERHRFCDPLFDPRVLKHVPGLEATLFGHSEKEKEQNPVLSVSEAAWHVLNRTEVDQRQYILGSPSVAGGLLATGDMTSYIKGMGPFFAVLLGRYIVQNPEQHLTNEVQPKFIRTLKVPDFYSEYREKGEGYAAFLGSSIIAKVTFHESQNKSFVNKAEYGENGPSAIIGMSPALL